MKRTVPIILLVLLIGTFTVAPLVAMPSVAAASSGLAADSSTKCVCGPKQVAVLLFDFVDVKHTRTPDYYQKIVKEMNASYYRQSYGKMWLVGGEVYGWYATDLHVGKVTTWNVNWDDARALRDYALVKAGSLRIADRYLFVVYAGNVWAFVLWDNLKVTVIGETRWDLGGFMHEFGHQIGLPDLYSYSHLDTYPVGNWDLMDNGTDLSSWSRMKLGWIPPDSVLKTYSSRELTVFINSLDSVNGTRVIKVQLGGGSTRYLLAETRDTAKGLQLVIYRIESGIENGKGSIVLEAVMNQSKPVFFDKKVNAAFIILDAQPDGLKVRITREAEGNKAQKAFDTLESASESLTSAWGTDRVQGFNEAKQELDRAWQSFHSSDFDAARTSADKAGELAKAAKIPESYSQFQEIRPSVETRIQNASAFKSDEAIHYIELAKSLLQYADGNFTEKNFDMALNNFLEANRALTKADEAERAFLESQEGTVTQPLQPSGGVPGFPLESLLLGSALGLLFGIARRRQRHHSRAKNEE